MKGKERALFWLRIGMDLTFLIGLIGAFLSADLWYPEVFDLSTVEDTVLPTTDTPITIDKIELIAGALGVEAGELGDIFNKEFTFWVAFDITFFFFWLTTLLSFSYYKKRTGASFFSRTKSRLRWWQKLVLFVEIYLLFICPIGWIGSLLYLSPNIITDNIYNRVNLFSVELMKAGIINTPFHIRFSVDYTKLWMFVAMSYIFTGSVEYFSYLLAKKNGYSFRDYFLYRHPLWYFEESKRNENNSSKGR